MKTKLTLSIEQTLIEQAKLRARERGTSVSQMVADYFRLLQERQGRGEAVGGQGARLPDDYEPSAFTRSLVGAFGTEEPSIDYEEAYHRHLEEKHS